MNNREGCCGGPGGSTGKVTATRGLVVEVYKHATASIWKAELGDSVMNWLWTGTSVNGPPTQTLSRIIEANVYRVPGSPALTRDTWWKWQEGLRPKLHRCLHISSCEPNTGEGGAFSTSYSQKGVICSLSFVSGDLDRNIFGKPPGAPME